MGSPSPLIWMYWEYGSIWDISHMPKQINLWELHWEGNCHINYSKISGKRFWTRFGLIWLKIKGWKKLNSNAETLKTIFFSVWLRRLKAKCSMLVWLLWPRQGAACGGVIPTSAFQCWLWEKWRSSWDKNCSFLFMFVESDYTLNDLK